MEKLKEDVNSKFSRASQTFEKAAVTEEERDYLRLFAFICELSFDVYLKTRMIEQAADQLREENNSGGKKR